MPKVSWDPWDHRHSTHPDVGGGDVAIMGRRKREVSRDKIMVR